METKKLGNSDMEITRIGFGAWAIGGSWQWGWGAQEDQQSIKSNSERRRLGNARFGWFVRS